MAAPTFVGFQQSAWNTTTSPKTTTTTAAAVGDVVVAVAGKESDVGTLALSGVGVFLSALRSVVTASRCEGILAGGFGAAHAVFTASGGVGSSNVADGSTNGQVSLVTTRDNSAVLVFVADFAAVDGAARTWLSVNGAPTERVYSFQAAAYTVYCATYADAGAAGTKTFGLSAPGGLNATVFAVEVLAPEEFVAPRVPPTARRKRGIRAAARDGWLDQRLTAASWFDAEVVFPDAGGGVTGTFASTLDGSTMSASGGVQNVGAFASSLAGVVMAASGSVAVPASGAFASTLAGITMASSGQAINSGAFASTLGGVTMAASGQVTDVGVFASTLAGVTMAASGLIDARGPFASTLGGVAMTATGDVQGAGIAGTFSAALSGVLMASSGQIALPGVFSSTLQGASMAASGQVGIAASGAFASTLDGVSMSAAGTVGAGGGGGGLAFFVRRAPSPRKVIRINP
jgi:hypothetical protein